MTESNLDAVALAEDAACRAQALTCASFLVEAPAGAGKTELLTQRVLKLLTQVQKPEEILALTFTNKAAAEMKSRIVEALHLAQTSTPPTAAHRQITFTLAQQVLQQDAALGWGLLQHPGRLRIMTLDAWNASLARQLPVLSGLGAGLRPGNDMAPYYEKAVRRTFALLETSGPFAACIAQALSQFDNDVTRLSQLLVAMLERREQWLNRLGDDAMRQTLAQTLHLLISQALAKVTQAWDSTQQAEMMPLARAAAGRLPESHTLALLRDWHTPLGGAIEELPLWRALCVFVLTNEGTRRVRLDKNLGFPAGKAWQAEKAAALAWLGGLSDAFVQGLVYVRTLPDAAVEETDLQRLEPLLGVLRLAVAQLWLVFAEAGVTDFIEIGQRALQALGPETEPTDLNLALDYRIQHVLVDEFQDTSPFQVTLLARMTAGWTGDDGRTILLVGDPMQSIYRFRKADVGLFLAVRTRGIGHLRLKPLRLVRNNRADATLVAWLNQCFPAIFPAQDDMAAGAIAYRHSVATRSAQNGSGVFLHLIAKDNTAAYREAQTVLGLIQAALADPEQESIAVLVRARTHLFSLLTLLRQAQISYEAVELETLADSQAVQDALTLCHALHHRGDRLHWLALLRAPWCGLTLADMHALVADEAADGKAGLAPGASVFARLHNESCLARLSADGQMRLRHVYDVMQTALARRGDAASIRDWLEGTWLALGGAATLRDETDIARMEAFFTQVTALEVTATFSPEALARIIHNTPVHVAGRGNASAKQRLYIMTIHKAKGLEFDTVIVPGMGNRPRNRNNPLVLWEDIADHQGGQPLAAALPHASHATGSKLYDYLAKLEKLRDSHETRRLLYVALTRARRRVHLVGVARLLPDQSWSAAAGSLLELLADAPERSMSIRWYTPVSEQVIAQGLPDEKETPAAPPLHRLAVPFSPFAEAIAKMTHDTPGRPHPDALRLTSASPQTAPLLGTLLHACLELIAGEGPEQWPPERLAACRSGWQAWLRAQGLAADTAEQAAHDCENWLTTTLASKEGRWVLSRHEAAHAEWALARNDAKVRIDRTFIAEGVRWIIEYKTGRPLDTLSAEEREAVLAQWRAQLQGYARYFAEAGLPIRLAVFLPATGTLLSL